MFPNYLEKTLVKLNMGKLSKFPTNYSEDPLIISPVLKTAHYKHQNTATIESLKYKGFAFFCETGTGKTKMALDNAAVRYVNNCIDRILVVCPLSSVGVWEEETKKHSHLIYTTLTGTKKQRLDNMAAFEKGLAHIAIINYEGLLVLKENLLNIVDDKTLLIFDESTFIKNPRKTKSQRTKIAMMLADKAGYRLILTGTPITNKIMDIFSQWYIVDKGEAFGKSWYKWREFFFTPDYMKFNFTPKPECITYVEKVLENGSIRIRKDDCLDLPEKIYEKRYVYMTTNQEALYKQMVKDFLVEIERQKIPAPVVLTQMVKLQQIANGFIYDENKKGIIISDEKLKVVLELLEENPKSNIIIWTHYKYDMELLQRELTKKVKGSVLLMTSKNVKGVCKKFQGGGHRQIIISNPQSCGYSVTLTAADIVIYYGNTFSSELRWQSEDRCHRIGLSHKVLYIDLITKDTIDEVIYEALSEHKNLMHEILDVKAFLTGG